MDFESDLGRLAERGERADPETVVSRALAGESGVSPGVRRRRPVMVAAAAGLVALAVGALAWVVGEDRNSSIESSPSASAPSGSPPATDPSGPLVPESDEIEWSTPVELGSITRSMVDGIVSGPSGFVATGMGFDDGRNQGRLWFTADGETWVEPAFELFDAKNVGFPASTASAFYVVAASNIDRTSPNGGEGQPSREDAQLYRSTDGRNWQPWGEPVGEFVDLASTGDTLLRSRSSGVEWSSDGLDWSPIEIESTSDLAGMQLGGAPLVAGTPSFLHGFDGDVFTIWTSTDGRSWTKLPDPPTPGFVVPQTDEPLLLSNPVADRCLDDVAMGDPSDQMLDQQWNCAAPLQMTELRAGTSTWAPLEQPGPGPTPSYAAVVPLGNTLVAAVTEPTKALTAWTTPTATYDWTPERETTLTYDHNVGSPGSAVAAGSTDQVIIVSEDRAVEGQTRVIVGTLQTPEAPTPPETDAADEPADPDPTTPPTSSPLSVSRPASADSPQPELAAGQARLWVSNQSFDDDPVTITIRIDDQVIIDDSFLVESQHNWMAFDITGLDPGDHSITAESDTGARIEETFTLPVNESRWLVLDYWTSDDERYFTFSESDRPVAFD